VAHWTSKSGRARAAFIRTAAAAVLAAGLVPAPALATGEGANKTYTETIDAGSSLAGNYLSAWVAGASRDTSAAAFFYRGGVAGRSAQR
jgi:hypothetical protein